MFSAVYMTLFITRKPKSGRVAFHIVTVYRRHSCLSNAVNALEAHNISVSVVDFEINGSFNLPSGDPLPRRGPLMFFFSDSTAEGVRAFPPSTRLLLQIFHLEPMLVHCLIQ